MSAVALPLPNRRCAQAPGGPASPSAWLILIFGVSMFVLLTSWAKLNPVTEVQILNDKRIFATALGAVVYWLTVRRLASRSDRTLGQMIGAALVVGIPGTALILVARELFDLFTFPDGSEGFARNVRWLLIWLGYYGAWVAGFVAIRLHRCATTRAAAFATASLATPAARPTTAAALNVCQSQDMADWLVDVIADELAAQPGVDRYRLSRRLILRAGYEQTDAALDPEAAKDGLRRDLTLRLAARLQRG